MYDEPGCNNESVIDTVTRAMSGDKQLIDNNTAM